MTIPRPRLVTALDTLATHSSEGRDLRSGPAHLFARIGGGAGTAPFVLSQEPR